MGKPNISGVWRNNKKGSLYQVVGMAEDSNNHGAHDETQVVYYSLESVADKGWQLHYRGRQEFLVKFSKVEPR